MSKIMSITADIDGALAFMDDVASVSQDAARPAAQAGAQVLYDAVKQNVAALGTEIQIRGIPFEVIGVLDEKGATQGSFENPDERILIPLQTGRYRIMGTDRLRNITVQVGSQREMNLAMMDIERVLRREHKIRPGQDNDFQIRRQADLLSTFQETTQTFTFLLAGIAAAAGFGGTTATGVSSDGARPPSSNHAPAPNTTTAAATPPYSTAEFDLAGAATRRVFNAGLCVTVGLGGNGEPIFTFVDEPADAAAIVSFF